MSRVTCQTQTGTGLYVTRFTIRLRKNEEDVEKNLWKAASLAQGLQINLVLSGREEDRKRLCSHGLGFVGQQLRQKATALSLILFSILFNWTTKWFSELNISSILSNFVTQLDAKEENDISNCWIERNTVPRVGVCKKATCSFSAGGGACNAG